MNRILKYLSLAALAFPAFSCTEQNLEQMEPATVMEQITIVMDDMTTAKLYTDASTGALTLPMVIGETITLDCTTVPEDISEITFPDLVWTSSNEDAVTVSSDGVLTATGTGTSVITVTTEAINTVATATLSVNVVETTVPATGITITADNDMTDEDSGAILCYQGDGLNFSAAITPDDATYRSVLWSVDNEEVGTIDPVSGVFTSLTTGNVTVTATSLDSTPITASVNVIVIVAVDPTGIRINNLPEDGEIFSLSQVSFTADYDEWPEFSTVSRITWVSDNEDVATVEDGVVTFHSHGTVRITATCPGTETPETGYEKEVSFTLNIPAGYYNDDFSDGSWPWWENDSQNLSGSSCERMQNEQGEWYLNVTPGVQNSENWRCDIQRVPDDMTVSAANSVPYRNNVTFLDRANYPIICLRIDDMADKGASNRSIFIDVNNGFVDASGSFDRLWSGRLGGGGANRWTDKYLCSDGSAILVYNLATQEFQTGGQLPETGVAVFPNFKIGYADIRTFASAEDASYRFFWFKTFESEAAMTEYLNEWSSETGITYNTAE